MVWAPVVPLTTGLVVNSAVHSSPTVPFILQPGEALDLHVEAIFPALGESHLLVLISYTLDDSSEKWTEPIVIMHIDNSVTPHLQSFQTGGLVRFYRARLLYALDHGTDSVTANARYRIG